MNRCAVPLAVLLAAACGGSKPPPKAPEAETTAASGELAGGADAESTPVASAEKTIGALRPQLRKCYDDALADDPKVEGAVKMVVQIDAAGAVTSAQPAADATLSPVVVDCIAKVLKGAKFSPPGPNGSTIHVPLSFHKEL